MKTGVIGLGAMGGYLALNLHYTEYLYRIWNRTSQKAADIAAKTGVTVSSSPTELAQDCELIITCVSRDTDLLEVITAIAAGIKPDAVVADTSTVSSETAKKAAAILAEKRAHFLDCPVSGGVEGAKNGTLAVMVGGDEKVLDKVRPVISALSAHIAYIGPSGSGQACKAVNQLMAAGINQAVCEALAFGQLMGLDMNKVVDIVSTGAAGNWFLEHRGHNMLLGKFTPGFKLGLHHKDLSIVKSMLENKTDVSLPLLNKTLDDYQQLMNSGHADEDISALYRLINAGGH